MYKNILERARVLYFGFLMFLLRKVCPVLFVLGKFESQRTLSIVEGNKMKFMLAIVELMTHNAVLEPIFEESLEIARLRSAGMRDEEVAQRVLEFLKK